MEGARQGQRIHRARGTESQEVMERAKRKPRALTSQQDTTGVQNLFAFFLR